MRLILVLSLLFFANCANQTTAQLPDNSSNQNTSTNQNSNMPINVSLPTENEKRVKELDKQNERFRQVPDEWKKVDFKNQIYRTKKGNYKIKLKNGEADRHDVKDCDNYQANLDDVFYLDLSGDNQKEAVVLFNIAFCGCGSCSGGNLVIYLYGFEKNKVKKFWQYETGSFKYSCGVKSLIIKEKKITIEQFGSCQKNSAFDSDESYHVWQAKNITKTVFSFIENKPKKEGSELFETELKDVKNYPTEISINE